MTRQAARGWKPFGWRQFTMEVPDDWELGGLGKQDDEMSGYLRLDDRNEVRMEIKWQYTEEEPDLDRVREDFLKVMQESAEKHGARLQIRKYARSEELVPRGPGRRLFPFHWSGGIDADGLAMYCTHCKRLTVMQVLSNPKRRDDEEIARVFHSLAEHRNEKALWAVHGLECLLPVDLVLHDQTLHTGYISLNFKDPMDRPVAVERFGLAEFIMADHENLAEWLREQRMREIGRAEVETRTTTIHGHEGLVMHATFPGRVGAFVRRTRYRLNKKSITYKHWRVWHCRPSNAIYCVYQGNQAEDDDLLPQIAADVVCHRGDDEAESGGEAAGEARGPGGSEVGARVTE